MFQNRNDRKRKKTWDSSPNSIQNQQWHTLYKKKNRNFFHKISNNKTKVNSVTASILMVRCVIIEPAQ